MIISIDSDLPTFKRLEFGPGLNVLLADKDPTSGGKKTRNSAGKSSVVEIVNFLLGAKAGPDALTRNPSLVDSNFTGVFMIAGAMVSVSRTGADASPLHEIVVPIPEQPQPSSSSISTPSIEDAPAPPYSAGM